MKNKLAKRYAREDRKKATKNINEYLEDIKAKLDIINTRIELHQTVMPPLPIGCSECCLKDIDEQLDEILDILPTIAKCRDTYLSDVVYDGISLEDYASDCKGCKWYKDHSPEISND